MSFMRSKNGAILIVAGIIVIGVVIGVAVYFATSVRSEEKPSNHTTTISPTTDPVTTTDPETTTDPGTTDPETTTDPENNDSTTETQESETPTPDPEPIDPTITLLFASTTDGRILRLDPTSGNFATIVHEDIYLVKTFDYYYKNQTLFYGTAKPNEPLKSNGKYEYSMENSAKWTKTAMSIDYVTENIYVLDGIAEKLYVLDEQTGYYAVVLTDLDEPRDIVIDSERRKMFILQKSSIITVDLDGQQYEVIDKNDDITAFAIDRKNGVLYYYTYSYNDKNYIRYFKYVESMSPENLVSHKRNILSMAVLDDRLFYISTLKNGSGKALNYYYLYDECTRRFLQTVQMEDEQALLLSQIKSYDNVEKEIVNPCANNNGGCPHLCISSNNIEQYVCKCNAGYQFGEDSKTCSRVEDYLMYVQDNKIKRRTLGDKGSSFVDMDLDIEIFDAQENQNIYFDYDSHSNMLVYASGPKVHYRNLSDDSEWSFEDETGCEVIPVIDWVSKNLYNIRNCNNAERNSYFSVRKLYEQSKDEKELWHYAKSIKSFVVLPNQGKVVFTLYDESAKKIVLHIRYLNGQWRTQLSDEAYETGLTVDFEKELVYFLMSIPIQAFALDFDSLKIVDYIVVRSVKNPKSIAAFQGKLYVANAKEIWRFGENRKNPTMMMQVKDDIQSFRIYSKKLQPIDSKNPCAVDNGGCQRYCFAVPMTNGDGLKSECGCNDIEFLSTDKKTCTNTDNV